MVIHHKSELVKDKKQSLILLFPYEPCSQGQQETLGHLSLWNIQVDK